MCVNALNAKLASVRALIKAELTAVFDSCHSRHALPFYVANVIVVVIVIIVATALMQLTHSALK